MCFQRMPKPRGAESYLIILVVKPKNRDGEQLVAKTPRRFISSLLDGNRQAREGPSLPRNWATEEAY